MGPCFRRDDGADQISTLAYSLGSHFQTAHHHTHLRDLAAPARVM